MSRLQTLKNIFARKQKIAPDDFAPDDMTADMDTGMDIDPMDTDTDDTPLPPSTPGGKKLFGFGKSKTADPRRQPAITSGKTQPYQFLGSIDEINQLAYNPPHPKTIIFLTGELILLSDTEIDSPENYSRQTDRIAKSMASLTKRATPFTLKLWLHKNVIDLQRENKRQRFAFAIDQYLHYGRAQKNNFLLVTGHPGNETIIQIFTFKNGALTAIEEKVLPNTQQPRFRSDYTELLNALYKSDPNTTIAIAAPLPEPESDRYSYIGNEIYKKRIIFPIVDDTAQPSSLSTHALPAGIILLAAAIYMAAIILPYNQYNQFATEFQSTIASLPQTDTTFGSDQLKTMQERRFFLTEERAQQRNIGYIKKIANTLAAEDNITIKTITLQPNKQQPSDPDIAIAIQSKRADNKPALDQAKSILERLSARLGITLRLAHNGYQEQKTPAGNFIQFNIEGNFEK